MKKTTLIIIAVVSCAATLFLHSCKKKEVLAPMRQFMTSSDITSKSEATFVTLSWKEAVNADLSTTTYTVEISKDSLFTGAAELSLQTDTSMIVLSDEQLGIRVKYFARVKTNGTTADLDSKWVYSMSFQVAGLQIFLPVKDNELQYNSVILRWDTTKDVAKVVLTPTGGAAMEYALSQDNIDSSYIRIDSLTGGTKYHAQILSATNKEKGYLDFTTKPTPVYSFVIAPGDDLAAIIDTCAANSVIGLSPGEYDASALTVSIKSKTVYLSATTTSGNPKDTRIKFKEFKLIGDDAGLSIKNIELDGLGTALYVFNFGGLASDAAAANFNTLQVENCDIHDYANCLIRANRGSAAGDHKIGTIKVTGSKIHNNLLTNLYTEFELSKLEFQRLEVTNSTFYTIGQNLLAAGTALPASAAIPEVIFDHLTINYFGANSKYLLFDAGSNPIKITFTNSIIGNSPRAGSIQANAFRATGASSVLVFSNNDYFKLNADATGTPLAFPTYSYLTSSGNITVDPGWLETTIDFTLPATSPLRAASTTGGPIGDPYWY